MPYNRIEKEEEKLHRCQAQLKRARDAERHQRRKLATLKHNARTHRLCTRGGMLESLLKRPGSLDPAELEDEQLRAFLAYLLSLPEAENKLKKILPLAPDGADKERNGGDDLTSCLYGATAPNPERAQLYTGSEAPVHCALAEG